MSVLYGLVILQQRQLTPELVFFVFYLLEQINSSLDALPSMFKAPISAWSGISHLIEYLNLDEDDKDSIIEQKIAKEGEVVGKFYFFGQK
jgi:ABC-type multidrug transport system fused ATPase/permease subunit